MSVAEDVRADRLIALAQERFEADLRPIEVQILRHSCRFDDPPDQTAQQQDGDLNNEDVGGIAWSVRPVPAWDGPELRPRFIRWLVTDDDAQNLLDAKGLRIWNACFVEPLDLRGCRISARLEFRYCLFKEEMILISSEMPSLYLLDSTLLKGIEGTRLALRGPCFLREVTVEGMIRLDQARIDAELCMENTPLLTLLMLLCTSGGAAPAHSHHGLAVRHVWERSFLASPSPFRPNVIYGKQRLLALEIARELKLLS